MSLNERVLTFLLACETSKQMQEKFKAIYYLKFEASLHVLDQKYYAATYDKGDDIGDHVAKLEHLVSQMKTIGEDISKRMLMAKILNTLPSKYAHFHFAWNSTSAKEKKLNNLTARLLIEEERLKNKQPEIKKKMVQL